MIALLLGLSLMLTDTKELADSLPDDPIVSQFLDEYTDWILSTSKSKQPDDDILTVEMEDASFEPCDWSYSK